MTAALKPYPAMKGSGVPWLGDVPEHWEVIPLGRIGRLFKGNGGSKEDEAVAGTPCVRYGDLYTQHGYFIRSTRACVPSQRASGYTPIHYGDLLFAASGETIDEIGKSAVNLLKEEARCGGDILILRPSRQAVPEFLGYASDSPASRTQKACMGRGFTVVHLYGSQLKGLALPLPPLPEQTAIVRFLDHANHRLEKAIRAKQKIIKLLNEQKQAIIHRAVTRGLDPNVRLKPSGVDWLGEIPEHWEVRRIKYFLREVDHRSVTGGETLLSMRMHHGLVPFAEHYDRPPQAATLVGFKVVQPGQIVVNRMQAGNGVIFASLLTGLVSPDYAVFDTVGDISAEYLGKLFRSRVTRAKFRSESKGLGTGTSGFLRLYKDRLGAIHVAIPAREEQDKILKNLAALLQGANATITTTEREISLLSEYRTRLIADVVTGKLDVREAAKGLPEAEEDFELPAEPDDIVDPGDECLENRVCHEN